MSLKERLTKFATTPGGVIPASPGFMPDDARKVLALIAAAKDMHAELKEIAWDEYSSRESNTSEAGAAALAAMEK